MGRKLRSTAKAFGVILHVQKIIITIHILDEWDQKITTFPGLYVIAVAYANAVDFVLPFQMQPRITFCSLTVLRSINIFFGAGNVYLILNLRRMHEVLFDTHTFYNAYLHSFHLP
jgi:hypothetical protein